MQLNRNDLRRTAEFAHAAVAATGPTDVEALVRRLRHVLAADGVHLQRITSDGVAEWRDPEPTTHAGDDAVPDVEHDQRRLTVSEPTSFGLVHLTTWRHHTPFRREDRVLLSLMAPYLTAAVATVGGLAPVALGDVAGREGTERTTRSETLTQREVQILALIAEGATNKEVAVDLRISPRTVQKHLEHIYAKLDLHRRTAAAGWWTAHLAAG